MSVIPVSTTRKQFVLQKVNDANVSDATLSKADGLALRIAWWALEPAKDRFDFKFFQSQMDRCSRLSKPMQFILLAGCNDAPTWLKTLGVPFTDGLPQPWHSVLQARYKTMIAALEGYMRNDGSLWRMAHIYTPGAESAEMHYKNVDGFYEQSGYSDAKLIGAQMGFAKTLCKAFPKSIVVSTLGDHDKAWALPLIAQMKAEFAGQIGFQINSLHASTPVNYRGYTRIRDAAAEGHHAGFQSLCPSSNVDRFGGTYDTYYQKFLATKAQWLQDYQSDVF